eukprot:13838333-Alexandrium_andersonii.AAC.1
MSFHEIRVAIFKALWTRYQGAKLGGSPDEYAVVIDETFFTRKKNARGGFQGRPSQGTKTIVVAG